MPKQAKQDFLRDLRERAGSLRKLPGSQSLYEIGTSGVRVYIRYSKRHDRNRTFYGLRDKDLCVLQGHQSYVCFLWDNQTDPLLVPYAEYEEVFQTTSPAPDGQYKTQVFLQDHVTELYIAGVGRFNVESHFGWESLTGAIRSSEPEAVPALSHPQVQTLLGAIGATKGYDVWIPTTDRTTLDWSITGKFSCRRELPGAYGEVVNIIREVDVLWIARGSSELRALFEVEHSTPIYSGLLRFNDIHLAVPHLQAAFSIVANDVRRSAFARQLSRPTFRASGLTELCSFLEYANVFGWYRRFAKAN